jgi:PAS domain-containing protein
MKRPQRLLFWAGLILVFFLALIFAFRAGELRLLAGFTVGFFAAVLLYVFYPLTTDPQMDSTPPAPVPPHLSEASERAVFIPGRNFDEMLQRLGSNESMLNVILNSMGEGVLLLNQADRVVLVNPSAEKVLGIPERDALGKHYLEVLRHPVLADLLIRAKTEGNLASLRGVRRRDPGGTGTPLGADHGFFRYYFFEETHAHAHRFCRQRVSRA